MRIGRGRECGGNITEIFEIVEDIRDIAKKYGYKLGTWWVPHDAKSHSLQTGKTMVQQLTRLGARPRLVPDEGLQQGIQAVRYSIPKMRIDYTREHCYEGVEALKAYRTNWSEKLQTYSNQPAHRVLTRGGRVPLHVLGSS